jgi:hypothetical protein
MKDMKKHEDREGLVVSRKGAQLSVETQKRRVIAGFGAQADSGTIPDRISALSLCSLRLCVSTKTYGRRALGMRV